MQKTKFPAITIALAVAMALPAWSQDLASVKKALDQKYAVTTTTADKTDIVKAGDVLVLKKSNLITIDVTKTMMQAPNTYKNGRITFPKLFVLAKEGTRTFVSGEKIWLTDINVKEKGVVLTLYTDAYNDVRYHGTLVFPFEKGSAPTADQVTAMVAEVFDIQPADNAASNSGAGGNGGNQQQAPALAGRAPAPQPVQQQAAAPAPVAAPAPIPPPPPPPADPKTIGLGQTVDQVTTNFGPPDKIIKLAGTKQKYVYKDMTVTFVGGKVTDIQ